MRTKFNVDLQAPPADSSRKEDVAALRMMTRDERIAMLMQSLDDACGLIGVRRRMTDAERPRGIAAHRKR